VSEDDDGDAFSLLGRRPNALLRDPCEKILHVRIEICSSGESRPFREVEVTSKRAYRVMPIKFIHHGSLKRRTKISNRRLKIRMLILMFFLKEIFWITREIILKRICRVPGNLDSD